MRTWLWIALAIAAVVMCLCVSCPKGGHKSYGGSSGDNVAPSGESTRGSGLFGGGVPSEPGDYVNAGSGWVGMTTDRSITGEAPSRLNPDQALTVSGDTVSYGWRLTPTEKQDSYTPELTSWIDLTTLSVGQSAGYHEDVVIEGGSIRGVDKSDYGAGYVLWEFKLPPAFGQYYELCGAKPPGFRYYMLLYQP